MAVDVVAFIKTSPFINRRTTTMTDLRPNQPLTQVDSPISQ
jgi:hypothetical protein